MSNGVWVIIAPVDLTGAFRFKKDAIAEGIKYMKSMDEKYTIEKYQNTITITDPNDELSETVSIEFFIIR